MVTRKQYEAAMKKLAKCQNDSIKASRSGNQAALDKASDEAAKALAVIVAYKSQK